MKTFKQLSIKTQILFIGVMILCIVTFLLIIIYQQSSKIIIDQNTEYNIELVSNIQKEMSSNYSRIADTMYHLGYDDIVQNFLQEADLYGLYVKSKQVQSLFRLVWSTNSDIVDIVVVNEQNKQISLSGKTAFIDQIRKYEDSKYADIYYAGFQAASSPNTQDAFIFGMTLYSSLFNEKYGKQVGSIFVLMDARSFQSKLEKSPRLSGASFHLITNEQLIYSNEHALTLQMSEENLSQYYKDTDQVSIQKINQQKYVIQSFSIPEINGYIVSAIPISNIMKELMILKRTSIITLIITLFLIAIPYSIVMMNILKPLGKLMDFMKKLKFGSLDTLSTRVDLEGYAEISVISIQFNQMLERIHVLTMQLLERTGELYQADIEKQRAEMSFLQSQINPHFLSNTLDTIKGIALVQKNEQIFQMASSLSRMLRYSIKGNNTVTLKEELDIVTSYVSIHQGRFPGRIHFHKYIDEPLYDIQIPKMIIQPLVENALTYGLEPHQHGGIITIEAYKQKNKMRIRIADNGLGMEPEKLQYVKNLLISSNENTIDHIGMKNVYERIRLYYRVEFTFEINSVLNEGTEIILILPLSREQ